MEAAAAGETLRSLSAPLSSPQSSLAEHPVGGLRLWTPRGPEHGHWGMQDCSAMVGSGQCGGAMNREDVCGLTGWALCPRKLPSVASGVVFKLKGFEGASQRLLLG